MITREDQHHHQEGIFDREYSTYKNYLVNWRRSYLKRIFKHLELKKGDRFLDVGVGGSGYTVIEAARKGIDAYGIDISREAVKKAKEFAQKNLSKKAIRRSHFRQAEAERLPYPNKYFDKLACIAVLEHVVDDEETIKELSRVLKENGILFLTVPNKIQSKYSLFRIFNNDRQMGHLRRYDKKDLIKLSDKYGFVCSYFYNGHYIKIFQHLFEIIFPPFYKKESKLWWLIDKLDLDDWENPNSYHITLILKKKTVRNNIN